MNGQRSVFECFLGIEHEGKRLVIHLDQMDGLFGGVPVDCRNRRNRVAGETRGIVEQIALVTRIATGPDDVAIVAGQNRPLRQEALRRRTCPHV